MFRKIVVLIIVVLLSVVVSSSAASAHSSEPWIRVRPLDDFIEGWMWPLGAEVTLTIDGPECEGYPKTKTVGVFPPDDAQTYVTFELQGVCDLQAGHVLTMTDGTVTATLDIAYLSVIEVNETSDSISGIADPGTSVSVWPHEAYWISIVTVADGSGSWTADFSTSPGVYDLMPGTGGAAIQTDAEGDETWIDWNVPSPRFTVGITHDWICGSEWAPDSTLSIMVAGGGPYSALSDGNGDFCTDLWEFVDLQAGQPVDVSDGSSSKSHTLLDLRVTGYDLELDLIHGTSNENLYVCLEVGGVGGVDCTPMSDGMWSVDVSSIVDLSRGMDGFVSQFDEDGDSTLVDWRVLDPKFDANITGNWINFMEFPPSTEVTVSVYESDLSPVPLFSVVGTSDDGGYGDINFWDLGLGEMVPGNLVELEGGGYLKDLILLPLTLDFFDPDTEFIAGTAPDGETVRVDACNEIIPDVEWDCRSEEALASGGAWSVAFTDIDLDPDSWFGAFITDDEGDSTWAELMEPPPPPFFEANITGNWVAANEFPAFTDVTVYVYESDLSIEPLFDATYTTNEWGHAWFNFWDLGIGEMHPWNYVEVEGGGYLKDLVLLPLTLDVFDPDTEYIAGTAPEGELVRVDVCNETIPDEEWDCRSEEVIAAGGTWFITFTDIDLHPESWYAAFISDGDGDSTMAELSPVPIILAAINGFVEAYDFGPGGTSARLEVHAEDGSGLKCEDNFSLPVEYNIWLDCAEVQPGDQILLFVNEEPVKDHVVFDLSLDDVDLGQGYFAGTAPPWSTVHVSICNPEQECFFAEDNTEDSTIWAIFIDPTSIDPQAWFAAVMFEEDGDHTMAQLPSPPLPFLTAWPFDDWVDGIGWPLGAMVELIIDDDHDPFNGALYTTTAESVPAPWNPDETWVGFNISGIFDLQPFHVVVMNHGDIFKVHEVTELAVTMTDPAVDIISGTAAPYSEVNVWVNWVEGAFVWATADGEGVWSADFTGVYDLEHGTGGVAAQFDDDGDGTWADWWIVTPGGIVDEILNMSDEDLAPELKRSLTTKIKNAMKSLDKGRENAAIGQLEAFINQVEAQRGKKISDETADLLISYAENLISQIEGG